MFPPMVQQQNYWGKYARGSAFALFCSIHYKVTLRPLLEGQFKVHFLLFYLCSVPGISASESKLLPFDQMLFPIINHQSTLHHSPLCKLCALLHYSWHSHICKQIGSQAVKLGSQEIPLSHRDFRPSYFCQTNRTQCFAVRTSMWSHGSQCTVMHSHGNVIFWKNFQFSVSL